MLTFAAFVLGTFSSDLLESGEAEAFVLAAPEGA